MNGVYKESLICAGVLLCSLLFCLYTVGVYRKTGIPLQKSSIHCRDVKSCEINGGRIHHLFTERGKLNADDGKSDIAFETAVPPRPVLCGIIDCDGKKEALIRETAAKKAVFLSEGDKAGGITVLRVFSDSVECMWNGRVFYLSGSDGERGVR